MMLPYNALKHLILDNNIPRQELINRCRRGDRQAFTQFIQTYQDTIFSHVCHTLGSERKAAHITRNVFVHAYRSFAELQDETAPEVWLFTIAEQYIHTVRQRQQRWAWLNLLCLFSSKEQLDADRGQSGHDEQNDLLLAYIDGELSEAETKQVEQRLAEDADYRREYKELQQIDMLIRCGSQMSAPVDLPVRINRQLDIYLFWENIRAAIARFRESISA